MSMQKFELRRDRFALFDQMENPAVNLSFTLALPDFRPWCKAQGLAPFHVLLCAVLRAVLKIDNFLYRVFDGEVIRIDHLTPSYTVINQNQDLNFAQFAWTDDVRAFVARSVAARDQASAMTELNEHYRRMSPRAAKDQVYITCIPWLDFTAIAHPVARSGSNDMPSLAWGKFKDGPGGRLLLPFSVQAHHGFVDGYHIHLLARQIGTELDGLMR